MKSEDYALLIGSAAAFGAIVLTMYVTRSLIGAAGAIRHKKRSEAGEAKRSQDQWFN